MLPFTSSQRCIVYALLSVCTCELCLTFYLGSICFYLSMKYCHRGINLTVRIIFCCRWWKDAQDSSSSLSEQSGILYTASPVSSYGGPMKLINNFFSSDLSFNLKKENDSLPLNCENGEVGVSGRDYALISGEMWLEALKW